MIAMSAAARQRDLGLVDPYPQGRDRAFVRPNQFVVPFTGIPRVFFASFEAETAVAA
jgi:hypothetical protein